MTTALNSLFFYGYISLLTVCFLSEILNPLVMVEGGTQRIFTFFSRNFQICHHQSVKSSERILKKFSESLPIMAGQRRKFVSLGPLKQLFYYYKN